MVSCKLDSSPPYSFTESLWYLDRKFDDCMHVVNNGVVSRAISTSRGPAVISVSGSGKGVRVQVPKEKAETLEEARDFVNEWLDLNRDIRPFYKILRDDPCFHDFPKKYRGFHLVGIPDLFECLVWCVAGQQISLPFAYMLKRRLVEAYGVSIKHGGKDYWLFPSPEVLAECSVADLRKFQFTTRKSEYIIGLSKAFVNHELSKDLLLSMDDEEKMFRHLLSFRGIGVWTANYTLMKSIRAMNRIPYGDAGVNQALSRLASLRKFDTAAVDGIFDRYEGWKTYLVYYLWRSRREMA